MTMVGSEGATRPGHFEVEVLEDPDDGVVVRLAGELDLATAPQLDEAIDGLRPPLVIDCADLEFLDSSGLSVLVKARRRFEDGLTIRNVRPNQRRLFELTGVEPLFWPDGQSPDGQSPS